HSFAFASSDLVQQQRDRLEVTRCRLVDQVLHDELALRSPLASAVLRDGDEALQLLLQCGGEVFGAAWATGSIAGLSGLELGRSRRLAKADVVGALIRLAHRSSQVE